ncbi:MAG: hypothetical protein ACREM9_12355, partial [Gemmatimonadales bacterium]
RCLEKRPADRWQSAAELLQALEAPSAPPAGAATTPIAALAEAPRARRRPLALLVLGLGLLTAVAGYVVTRQSGGPSSLDPNLVAVAPFDVPDPRLSLWREGLVDLLSRSLDGAGPLRSVPPTTVIRRWSGRADQPSALALGRHTGARLLVYGSLIGTGPDSARLTVTVLDVQEQRPIAEIELRDAADRMDRLTDSLTVRLLRELGRTRRIEVFGTASLGSTSLPALKAFLQGEQWFRRTAWDSALASYEHAIAIDSTFPLALRRAGQVLGWQRSAFDSTSQAFALRAGALNHGLSPRDSLLVTTDSLFGAAYMTIPLVDWSVIRRVHDVARELTRRYPDDFESWYALGEANYHLGEVVGSTPRQALDAFDRAIATDSSFAPSYIHAIELALLLEGPEAATRYAGKYLSLDPTDASASGIVLTERILAAAPAGPAELRRILGEATPGALDDAWLVLRLSADSAEAAVEVARALLRGPQGDLWVPRSERELRLGQTLLYRGHVRDATRILYGAEGAIAPHLVEAALLSPDLDSAGPLFHRWLTDGRIIGAAHALPWWAAHRDTASIRLLRRLCDSVSRAARNDAERGIAAYTDQAALAYLDLVRRDTASAVRRLEALPDSLCPVCYLEQLTRAQLLSARHDDAEAAALLDRSLTGLAVPSVTIWSLERARVAERLGDREKAAREYQYVADVWRHADPGLQPYVAEAKEGLARLAGEPRPVNPRP